MTLFILTRTVQYESSNEFVAAYTSHVDALNAAEKQLVSAIAKGYDDVTYQVREVREGDITLSL